VERIQKKMLSQNQNKEVPMKETKVIQLLTLRMNPNSMNKALNALKT
jgi:hypothetical protein